MPDTTPRAHSKPVPVRFRPEEWEMARALADRRGLTVADLIRQLIREAAAREVPNV
jgi:macrodomain Ter protein organizer (MatP/YcbG family)